MDMILEITGIKCFKVASHIDDFNYFYLQPIPLSETGQLTRITPNFPSKPKENNAMIHGNKKCAYTYLHLTCNTTGGAN
mgnify:CR=1 FL=1